MFIIEHVDDMTLLQNIMEHGLMEVNLAQAILKSWILHYLKTTQWADCVTLLTVVCYMWTIDYAILVYRSYDKSEAVLYCT